MQRHDEGSPMAMGDSCTGPRPRCARERITSPAAAGAPHSLTYHRRRFHLGRRGRSDERTPFDARSPSRHPAGPRRPCLPVAASLRAEIGAVPHVRHLGLRRRRERAAARRQRRRRAVEGSARRAPPDHRAVRRREEADRGAARAADEVGQAIFHANREHVDKVEAMFEAITAAGDDPTPTLAPVLDYVESDPSLFDADRLAFRDVLASLQVDVARNRRSAPSACTSASATTSTRSTRSRRTTTRRSARSSRASRSAPSCRSASVGRLRRAPGQALHARADPEGARLCAGPRPHGRGQRAALPRLRRPRRSRCPPASPRPARSSAPACRPRWSPSPSTTARTRSTPPRSPPSSSSTARPARSSKWATTWARSARTASRTWARTPRSAASCWPRATSSATTA